MGLISPTLPTIGQPNSTEDVDVLNALTDLVNLVNGQLDANNVVAALKPTTLLSPWRTIAVAQLAVPQALGAVVVAPVGDGGGNALSGGYAKAIQFLPFRAADLALAGMTTRLRVKMGMLINTIAPARNFTGGLYSLTSGGGSAGNLVYTAALVSGSGVTRNTPAANGAFVDVSASFTPPADGSYVLAVSESGSIAVDSAVHIALALEVQHT